MKIGYLDHAVIVLIKTHYGELRSDFSPGLVDLDSFPQLAPHTFGGHLRRDPPLFQLLRCCPACENSYKLGN